MRWILIIFLSVLSITPFAAAAQAENCIFFSEYIEGGSFNKAVEIYNASGDDINLSSLQILLYSNGAATPSSTVTLPAGTLVNGGTYVVANASSAAAILAVTDLTNSAVMNFNGDDALELRFNGIPVDFIGQVGFDPGSSWGTEPNTTVNHTLVRLNTVCCGDATGSDAYDPAGAWTAYVQDTFSWLGSHTTDCLAVAAEGENWGSLKSRFR